MYLHSYSKEIYCYMTPKSRNSGARVDVHCYARTRYTGSGGNEHAHNNSRTTVSMQRRGKHTSITVQELIGHGVFCWAGPEAIWRGSQAAGIELRESLETAVEDDWEKMATESQLNLERIELMNWGSKIVEFSLSRLSWQFSWGRSVEGLS
jgi:hypothetical protein